MLGRRLGLAAGAVALAVAGMTLASLPAQAASTHYTGHFTYEVTLSSTSVFTQ